MSNKPDACSAGQWTTSTLAHSDESTSFELVTPVQTEPTLTQYKSAMCDSQMPLQDNDIVIADSTSDFVAITP